MGYGIATGAAGGSGGGATGYNNDGQALGGITGGTGVAGQGFRGGNQGNAYYSGGGGGAGAPGADGNNRANGGIGVYNAILGTGYYWAGGGGGAGYSITGGNAGAGGGGAGAVANGGTNYGGSGLNAGSNITTGVSSSQTNTPGGDAGANTGGGGGAGAYYNYTNKGGDGGSGIVVVRYPGPQKATGGTVTSVSGYTIHTFTSSGTFTPGANWGDVSSSSITGALTNGPTYNSANGGYITFDGSNDFISILNNTALDTQTPTVEVWVKTNATSQNGFWFEKGTVNSQYALFQEGGTIVWRQYFSNLSTNTSLYATTASYMSASNWAHVVGTFTSGVRSIYINGVLVSSDAQAGIIGTNAAGMTVGCYGGGGYMYNGNIGIVRVYTRTLTATEVAQNFNALRGRYGI
jgi:hypothetical protein